MEHKKAWEKYVDKLNADKELLDTYRKLRHAFKREGWSEKDLERISSFPPDIYFNSIQFSNLRNKLFFELKGFFTIIDEDEFNDYIRNRLKLIDLEIPLENGNKKRND